MPSVDSINSVIVHIHMYLGHREARENSMISCYIEAC